MTNRRDAQWATVEQALATTWPDPFTPDEIAAIGLHWHDRSRLDELIVAIDYLRHRQPGQRPTFEALKTEGDRRWRDAKAGRAGACSTCHGDRWTLAGHNSEGFPEYVACPDCLPDAHARQRAGAAQ